MGLGTSGRGTTPLRLLLVLVVWGLSLVVVFRYFYPGFCETKSKADKFLLLVRFDENTGVTTNGTFTARVTSTLVNRSTLSTAKLTAYNSDIISYSNRFFHGFSYEGRNGEVGINDIFIAIKTTIANHRVRLPLLMDTWIPQAVNSVRFCLVSSLLSIHSWLVAMLLLANSPFYPLLVMLANSSH